MYLDNNNHHFFLILRLHFLFVFFIPGGWGGNYKGFGIKNILGEYIKNIKGKPTFRNLHVQLVVNSVTI